MTRYKQYARTKGVRLESDYPMMPFVKGLIALQGVEVSVCDDGVLVLEHYDVGSFKTVICRDGNFKDKMYA